MFANGGIIVSQPPRFLFLKDTNGDDKADVREEIMTGWGIGDTHAQANNLHYGYDNWIYGCVGYSGFNGDGRRQDDCGSRKARIASRPTARRWSSCTSSRTTRGARARMTRAINSAARPTARRFSTAAFPPLRAPPGIASR